MSEAQDAAAVVEQELHEQERGLAEMEIELYGQETGLIAQEAQFLQKHRALLGFAGYVQEEEAALLRRLDGMSAEAGTRARQILGTSSSPGLDAFQPSTGAEDRMVLLERRRDLYAMRLEIIEAREVLLEQRTGRLEAFSGSVDEIENRLLARQRLLGEVAREIFMGGVPAGGASAPIGRAPAAAPAPTPKDTPEASDKPRGRLNPVKVTLEARLDAGAGAASFESKGKKGELPVLFMPTPNLLKVGREVRVLVSRAGDTVEVRGVVSWVRERGHNDGPPGMALELIEVGASERATLVAWQRA